MPFTPEQQQSLLAQKGVGKTVLQRLQQMGLDDTAKLAAGRCGRYFAARRGVNRLDLLEKQPASQSGHCRSGRMG